MNNSPARGPMVLKNSGRRGPYLLKTDTGCKAAKYRGGACHLPRGHSGEHECNAVGGNMHKWR